MCHLSSMLSFSMIHTYRTLSRFSLVFMDKCVIFVVRFTDLSFFRRKRGKRGISKSYRLAARSLGNATKSRSRTTMGWFDTVVHETCSWYRERNYRKDRVGALWHTTVNSCFFGRGSLYKAKHDRVGANYSSWIASHRNASRS